MRKIEYVYVVLSIRETGKVPEISLKTEAENQESRKYETEYSILAVLTPGQTLI